RLDLENSYVIRLLDANIDERGADAFRRPLAGRSTGVPAAGGAVGEDVEKARQRFAALFGVLVEIVEKAIRLVDLPVDRGIGVPQFEFVHSLPRLGENL